jgi:hypothetical protein
MQDLDEPFKKQFAPGAHSSPPSHSAVATSQSKANGNAVNPLRRSKVVFGRAIKLPPHYCTVSEPFICCAISPTTRHSLFPSCLEALIYRAEDRGLEDVGKIPGRRLEPRCVRPQG